VGVINLSLCYVPIYLCNLAGDMEVVQTHLDPGGSFVCSVMAVRGSTALHVSAHTVITPYSQCQILAKSKHAHPTAMPPMACCIPLQHAPTAVSTPKQWFRYLQRAAFKNCADTIASQSVVASRATRDRLDQAPPKEPAPPKPAAYATAVLAQHGDPLNAALREVEKLRRTVARKDELLRVRNAQLVDVFNDANEREKLWGLASSRMPPPPPGI
jgi:hypothetical protein